MGRDALSRLFGIIGGFVSLYALSAWSLSQGGTQLSDVPGLEPRAPAQSALFAIAIIGVVLSVVCAIGIVHLRHPAGATGWRFPIVGLGETKIVDPRALSTRLYVGVLATLLLILPAAALVHLNRRLFQDGRVWNENLPAFAVTKAACAVPTWPFGSCEKADDRAWATSIFAVPEFKNGVATVSAGRLWLSSHSCDFQWNHGLAGPQGATRLDKGGKLLTSSEESVRRNLKTLPPALGDRLRAASPKPDAEPTKDPEYCAGSRDRSPLCIADEAKCRGVEWVRIWSPATVIVPSLLGWGGVLAFFVMWWRLERLPAEAPTRSSGANQDETDPRGNEHRGSQP